MWRPPRPSCAPHGHSRSAGHPCPGRAAGLDTAPPGSLRGALGGGRGKPGDPPLTTRGKPCAESGQRGSFPSPRASATRPEAPAFSPGAARAGVACRRATALGGLGRSLLTQGASLQEEFPQCDTRPILSLGRSSKAGRFGAPVWSCSWCRRGRGAARPGPGAPKPQSPKRAPWLSVTAHGPLQGYVCGLPLRGTRARRGRKGWPSSSG